MNGSYATLKGGSASEAMEDFTGGVSELIELHNPPKDFFGLVQKSIMKKSLMSCAIEVRLNRNFCKFLVFTYYILLN